MHRLGVLPSNDDQANQAQMTACIEFFRYLQRSCGARNPMLEALRARRRVFTQIDH
ncbi:Phenylalanyl-tRNA synthetase beta subunit [Pseudomonas syringae pv. actinidiae]|uniref:Phenylalanyl-tRNA synthetase beta subunit n=1 Tax=Pseudomonas syringae pv. actinidiae TaxID=103796 RepID=A0AAN4Q7F0_PSESF|nr:Phenylalanyl-tRNA synthetase beta subunit [Pseudomonas syringae pv. actinidiae]